MVSEYTHSLDFAFSGRVWLDKIIEEVVKAYVLFQIVWLVACVWHTVLMFAALIDIQQECVARQTAKVRPETEKVREENSKQIDNFNAYYNVKSIDHRISVKEFVVVVIFSDLQKKLCAWFLHLNTGNKERQNVGDFVREGIAHGIMIMIIVKLLIFSLSCTGKLSVMIIT